MSLTIKPSRTVTPDQAEGRRMADSIKTLYGRNEAWVNFMLIRQTGASIERLREIYAEVTGAAQTEGAKP